MSEFKAGDRVRVRDVRAVGSFAGQVGTVVAISRTPAGTADGGRVKLDKGLSGGRADKGGIFFGLTELEPVATGKKRTAKKQGKAG